jgi:hypothetical protein
MNRPENIVPCTVDHLRYIAGRARPDEKAQIEHFTAEKYQPDAVAKMLESYLKQGPCYTLVGPDSLPVMAGGYVCLGDQIWQSWMIGTTQGWEKNWLSITRAARWMIEAMFQIGAKRLETYVMPGREKAVEWYTRSLGLERESDGLYVRAA